MIDVKKLPVHVLQAARESMGIRFDDASKDSEIANMYPSQLLERYVSNEHLSISQSSPRIYDAAVGIFLAVKK